MLYFPKVHDHSSRSAVSDRTALCHFLGVRQPVIDAACKVLRSLSQWTTFPKRTSNSSSSHCRFACAISSLKEPSALRAGPYAEAEIGMFTMARVSLAFNLSAAVLYADKPPQCVACTNDHNLWSKNNSTSHSCTS